MIILDINMVSESMKPAPEAAVRAWLNDQATETLYLSSVTLAELLFDIGALPAGKRKECRLAFLTAYSVYSMGACWPSTQMQLATMPN